MARIYAACLASYNNGTLHGEWIDLDGKDESDVDEEIRLMLKASPYPNVVRRDVKCPSCLATSYIDVSSPSGTLRKCSECDVFCDCTSEPYPSAEEFAIHDHEGFEGVKVGEYDSIGDLVRLSAAIEEHGEAFAAFYDHYGNDVDGAVSKFEDAYRGCHKSVEEYAEELLDDCGTLSDLPANLRYYFDYAAFARDMELNGEIWTHNGDDGVHVFDGTI